MKHLSANILTGACVIGITALMLMGCEKKQQNTVEAWQTISAAQHAENVVESGTVQAERTPNAIDRIAMNDRHPDRTAQLDAIRKHNAEIRAQAEAADEGAWGNVQQAVTGIWE